MPKEYSLVDKDVGKFLTVSMLLFLPMTQMLIQGFDIVTLILATACYNVVYHILFRMR